MSLARPLPLYHYYSKPNQHSAPHGRVGCGLHHCTQARPLETQEMSPWQFTYDHDSRRNSCIPRFNYYTHAPTTTSHFQRPALCSLIGLPLNLRLGNPNEPTRQNQVMRESCHSSIANAVSPQPQQLA